MADMIEIGGWRVRSVVNGHIRLDGGAMFGVVPKTLWSKVAPADEQNRILLATRTLIAVHKPSGRLLLVDTGTGSKWPADKADRYAIESNPSAIDEALADIGAAPGDVTDIIATHLHFDHCGGMTVWADESEQQARSEKAEQKKDRRQKLRFPNARHWVHRAHWQHAHQPTLRDRASFIPVDFALFDGAASLSLVDDDSPCPIADLRWEFSDGHTPRQLLPRFSGGGATPDLLFIGDLTPTAAHLPPAWVMGYDLLPLATLEERQRVHRRCKEEGLLIAFPHDPKCGIVELAFDGDRPRVEKVLG